MSSKKFQVITKVYQNSSLVSEVTHPLKKRKAFFLNNKEGAPLSIPFYPFKAPIPLFEVRSNGLHLNLGFDPWKGFLRINQNVFELNGDGSPFQATLKPGDYASLAIDDLMVILKITAAQNEKTIKKNAKLAPSLSYFLFDNPRESAAFLWALLSTLVLLLGFYIFVLGYKRPSSYENPKLDSQYTLPFVSPDHLFTAPEALKENLDRREIISSVTGFYTNLTYMLLGWPVEEKKYLYPSSMERWKGENEQQDQLLQKEALEQRNLDQSILKRTTPQGLVRIPSVRGKSLQLKLSQVLTSLGEYHRGLENLKNLRREIVGEFQQDPEYNWYNYISPKDKSAPPPAFEGLSKIKVFNSITNEESMYLEAHSISLAAKKLQDRIFHNSEAHSLQPKNHYMLVTSENNPYATFLSNFGQNPLFDDSSLDRLPASRFTDTGVAVLAKVREPLIGRLSPQDIKIFIEKHQWEINICYEMSLRKNPSLQGFMTWKWILNTTGRAQDVLLVKSTVNDRQFLDCVQKKVESWRYPPPKYGSVIVNHTFRFKPLTP